jgi:hypothetical protein
MSWTWIALVDIRVAFRDLTKFVEFVYSSARGCNRLRSAKLVGGFPRLFLDFFWVKCGGFWSEDPLDTGVTFLDPKKIVEFV